MGAAPAPPAASGWLERNWKWFVPLLVVLVLASAALFVGGIFALVAGSMRSSEVAVNAVERARQHPVIRARLGEPLETGWLISGSISTSGPSGSADLAIPLSGSKSSATLYLRAEKQAGAWRYELLEVDLPGEKQRVKLLPF